MISIDYKLEDAGWAVANIGNGDLVQTMTVSYLHDTLKQLGESAIFIKEAKAKRVIFMDEPGEHHLLISNVTGNEIAYELRWYDDWTDWNAIEDENYELVLTGKTTIVNYVNEVRNVLKSIWDEFGLETYKKKWVNHEFPQKELEKLK